MTLTKGRTEMEAVVSCDDVVTSGVQADAMFPFSGVIGFACLLLPEFW